MEKLRKTRYLFDLKIEKNQMISLNPCISPSSPTQIHRTQVYIVQSTTFTSWNFNKQVNSNKVIKLDKLKWLDKIFISQAQALLSFHTVITNL